MIRKLKLFMEILLISSVTLFLGGCNVPILEPKGIVALHERNLILIAVALMLIVVIPVFIMTFVFAWKYRASNTKAKYDPEFTHSTWIELICWGVPCAIIAVLATITWISTHELDPYKPLDVSTKPITIQAISLDWKWLFIYPEQNIATINYIQFPVNVPINFKITSDAPMNSLWIPELSGQIYSMTGMQTKLHMLATTLGDYNGGSASFSGAGFSDMNFITRVSTQEEFDNWVTQVKKSPNTLSASVYDEIAKPSEKTPVTYYSSVKEGLYQDIINKFMSPMGDMKMSMPTQSTTSTEHSSGMSGMSDSSM